jgi:hypothetical protein
MADARATPLGQLIAPAQRLALVGLAKNTGKTETLTAILDERERAGVAVAVTSIGRDGESHDVIDARIEKPLVRLQAGALVATTGPLLRASGLAHERLLQTQIRTPLGEVVVARLREPGALEVAGPNVAADVRAVSDAMLELGAEQVLIDGAVDRRAASSPAVADGIVMATGAVLGQEIERVVAATAEAVEVARLPLAKDASGAVEVEREIVLQADPGQVASLLERTSGARTLAVHGALGEGFLQGLLAARRGQADGELRILAEDPTRVFLSQRAPSWYRRQGLSIEVRRSVELKALTVNPVAPQSHRFDSDELRAALAAVADGVAVIDVRDPGAV